MPSVSLLLHILLHRSQSPTLSVRCLLLYCRRQELTQCHALMQCIEQLLYLHSVICVLELGSDPTPQMCERWPPFCHPTINHPQECPTTQAKLGKSLLYGEDERKTFIMVEKTY